MATALVSQLDKQSKNIADLLAFIKQELDADAERHASLQASAAVAGDVLQQDSQTGATLDLSKKKLSALPVEAIGLMKHKVERLAVSHNPQISLPPQIIQCERLRYLNIRWNQLTHFPDVVLQLSKLEILDLSGNKITALPEDIKKLSSLKFLAVAKNRITRLPLALGEMSSLGKLKFEENPLAFPPPDAIKLSPDRLAGAHDAEREKEMCQKVKRFLRAAAVKEKLRIVTEDDQSEDHVETPRPPKRTAIAGRFPIRPSISGLDSMIESKPDPSLGEPGIVPPIPHKSHARVESSNTSSMKRPGAAPLLNGGNDGNRSRSETVSSWSNLRQRRQGYVPTRRPTGDLEALNEDMDRLTPASMVRPSHVRASSSISTTQSTTGPSSGDTSGAVSPVDAQSKAYHTRPSYKARKRLNPPNAVFGICRRLNFILPQLWTSVSNVTASMRVGPPHASALGRYLQAASTEMKELSHRLDELESGPYPRSKPHQQISALGARAAINAIRCYEVLLVEFKRRSRANPRDLGGPQVRAALFQSHFCMVELQNMCSTLGLKITPRPDPLSHDQSRVSQAWSSKSVTPTQPKAPSNRRMARPAMLQGLGSQPVQSGLPPPPMRLQPDWGTMQPMGSPISMGTLRPAEPYSRPSTSQSSFSRTNPTRSPLDGNEGDESFEGVFMKLEAVCNLAGQILPQCRKEFLTRKETAKKAEQLGLSAQWTAMANKCDEVLAHNWSMKKRLEAVKVGDHGLRYQRDFWVLCDTFVHSWTAFATDVKDLSHRRIDITAIKPLMRTLQRQVTDVYKAINRSPMYSHARSGSKGPENAIPTSLASPLPLGWKPVYASQDVTPRLTSPLTASPLSAALGPAVLATVATTPTPPASAPRENLNDLLTAKLTRDRNDTPMQQPHYPRRI